MLKKKLRSVFLSLLIILLIFTSMPTSFAASKFTDTTGHWAEQQLLDWSEKGWISGYPDGSIRPDAPVTRAEYMALINRAFGFQEQADISFNDLKSKDWQYPIIAVAVKAGYVKGYADGSIHPDTQVSRQEAAIMLAAPLNIPADTTAILDSFKDASQIAAWSQKAVASLVNKNVIAGYKDLTFGPTKAITRAEAVVMINRALKVRTTNYAVAGSYGPDGTTETLAGNVAIQVTGVTLKNMVIEGDLLFAAGIGSGDAFLKNVTVRGKTIVNGGGSNSIHFEDSSLGSITVNKPGGDVRIVAEGTTTVNEVNVESGAKIEQSHITKGGFASVNLSEKLSPDSIVTLTGSFDNVDIAGKGASLELSNGSIGKLNVNEKATGSTINMDKDSIVKDLVLNAEIHAKGAGKIEKATVNEQAKNTVLDVITAKLEGKGSEGVKFISPSPTPSPSPKPTVDPNAPVYFPPSGGGPPVSGGDTNQAPSVSMAEVVPLSTNILEVKLVNPIAQADKTLFSITNSSNQVLDIQSAELAAYDKTKKTVLLKLQSNTNAGSLYALRTTSSFLTFTGLAMDNVKPTVMSIMSNSPHEVIVEFNKPIQLTGANFQINLAYSSEIPLKIISVQYLTKTKIVIQTANQRPELYKLAIVGMTNFFQIGLDDFSGHDTFVGQFDDGNISTSSKAKVILGNKIYIELGENYQLNKLSEANITFGQSNGVELPQFVNSISQATKENALDYGYSDEALAQAATARGIVIALKTNLTPGMIYEVNITNLFNAKNELLAARATFIGTGVEIGLPKVYAVFAMDNQTIKVFFDRNISNSQITGPIYNNVSHNIVANTLFITNSESLPKDLFLDTAYAIQDSKDENALLIRLSKPKAFSSQYKNVAENAFKLTGVPAKINSDYISSVFAPSEIDPKQIVIDGVIALSSSVIRVYFNQAVYGSLVDFAKVGTTQSNAVNNFSNAVAINNTKEIYDFTLSTPLTSTQDYWLVANPLVDKAIIGDAPTNTGAVSIVTLKDENDVEQGIQQVRRFSGNLSTTIDLIEVAVMMADDKTIKIYYPTIMNTSQSTNSVMVSSNYSIVNQSSTRVNMEGGAQFNAITDIAQIKYSTFDNIAILTLNKRIISPSNDLYLKFATTISNAAGTQYVKQGSSAIMKQFAPNPVPSVKVSVTSATYNANTGTVTIKLNQLAKSDSNLIDFMNAIRLLSVFDLKVMTSGGITHPVLFNEITNVYAEDGFGNGSVNTSLNYFDTLVIQLSPLLTNQMMADQLVQVKIKNDSMIGINGNRTEISCFFAV